MVKNKNGTKGLLQELKKMVLSEKNTLGGEGLSQYERRQFLKYINRSTLAASVLVSLNVDARSYGGVTPLLNEATVKDLLEANGYYKTTYKNTKNLINPERIDPDVDIDQLSNELARLLCEYVGAEYRQRLSPEEIRQVTSFYQSPVGKKFVQAEVEVHLGVRKYLSDALDQATKNLKSANKKA